MPVPVADAHTHTNPVTGMGASRIAGRFKESGGWFMAIVALSPWAYNIEYTGVDSYRSVLDLLARECMEAEEAGLKTACLAGFHPADVDRLIDNYRLKPEEVLEVGLSVVELIGEACREGFPDGIGEVGRQHYKTGAERVMISELILERAIEVARDNGCLVHMHLENIGGVTVRLVDAVVERLGAGASRGRLVFHHVKPSQAVQAAGMGYPSTIPGTPELLRNVLGEVPPIYMLESDHIDDPMRPGAVVYPWVMAESVQKLARRASEEYLYKVNVDNVVRVYGVEPP